jgi:hypothetical protein
MNLADLLHRNFGILIGYIVFFMVVYILAAEYITADRCKGEILFFRRKHISTLKKGNQGDEESASEKGPAVMDPGTDAGQGSVGEDKTVAIQEQTNILHWRNLTYDVPIKGGIRRISDHVDGWVKPGSLTALMVSIACPLNLFLSDSQTYSWSREPRVQEKPHFSTC